jgi:hypothetical protein
VVAVLRGQVRGVAQLANAVGDPLLERIRETRQQATLAARANLGCFGRHGAAAPDATSAGWVYRHAGKRERSMTGAPLRLLRRSTNSAPHGGHASTKATADDDDEDR